MKIKSCLTPALSVLTAALLTFTGCTSGKPPVQPVAVADDDANPVALGHVRWMLTELNGQFVAPGRDETTIPVLEFDPAKQAVSGSSGINLFMGSCELAIGKLKFNNLAMTRRAGAPELMEQETAFMRALGAVTDWKRIGNRLELLAGKKTVVAFAAHP